MDTKKLLAAASAAGYAMALPEDFDDPRAAPVAVHPPCDHALASDGAPSRALVVTESEPARGSFFRDWIAALWVGRAAA